MQAAALWRRFAALFYDALLLLALWFATAGFSLAFTGGQAVDGLEQQTNYLLTAAMVLVTFLFYGWFWTHGGQTLGMRVWKVRTVLATGEPMTWLASAMRFTAAGLSWGCLGLGYLWALIDPAQRTWHDRLSKTEVIFEPLKKIELDH